MTNEERGAQRDDVVMMMVTVDKIAREQIKA